MSQESIEIAYAIMEGLGNKILVLDLREKDYRIKAKDIPIIIKKSAYNFDQLMAIYSPGGDLNQEMHKASEHYFIEIWNQDASKAEACGNGIRCVVAYLYHVGSLKKPDFSVILRSEGGEIFGQYLEKTIGTTKEKQDFTRIILPPPNFDRQSIGLVQNLSHEALLSFGKGAIYYPEFVSIGNPHAVFFSPFPLKELDAELWLREYGPILECDEIFTNRCNINLAHISSLNTIEVRTWERGAGLTEACGTGACATMVAARLRGVVQNEVKLFLSAGILNISWSGNKGDPIVMCGPSSLLNCGRLYL